MLFRSAERLTMSPARMLNDHIKDARERAGLTLADASVRLGIAKTSLFRLERGEAPITASKLPMFARAYGTTISDLIDNRVRVRSTEQDLLEIALVAQMIEEVIQGMSARPNPKVLGKTVAEIIRLSRDDQVQRLDGQFDPTRYRGIVAAYLGGGADVGAL
jgi:transcriptional regulator with XRE-family HTH domain